MTHPRCLLFALFLVLSGLVAGCGHRSGREVGPHDLHNLELRNGEHHTLTLYVDGGELGSVPADDVGYFWVRPGRREVEVRYGNDLNPRIPLGEFFFRDDIALVING